MRSLSSDPFVPTDVLIRFEDGSELVTVPRGATLAYISETLNRLSLWHCGKALSIDVHFQASDESGSPDVAHAGRRSHFRVPV